jgi:hypothetical protein
MTLSDRNTQSIYLVRYATMKYATKPQQHRLASQLHSCVMGVGLVDATVLAL